MTRRKLLAIQAHVDRLPPAQGLRAVWRRASLQLAIVYALVRARS